MSRVELDIIARDNASRTLDKVAGSTDKATDSLKDMGEEAKSTDSEIARLQASLAKLREEIDKAPDDKSLIKAYNADRRALSFLEKVKADAAKAAGIGKEIGEELGEQTGKGITRGLGDALAALPAQVKGAGIVAGVGLGALMAPFIGAAVGGAVLGGVGGAGIIGGIAAASQDQRVKDAGERLAGSLSEAFGRAAEPMVEPLLSAIGTLEGAGAAFASSMRQNFAGVAPVLKPLAEGVAGFSREIGPGLAKAFEASKPVLRVLANELPKLGDAIGDALGAISEGGDGGALALAALFDVVGDGIRSVGSMIGMLGLAYEWIVRTGAAAGDAADAFLEWGALAPMLIPFAEYLSGVGEDADSLLNRLDAGKDTTRDFAGGLGSITTAAEDAAAAARNLDDAFNELFNKELGLKEATLQYKQGIRELREELVDGERTINDNTEAGQENLRAINDQVAAIEALRDAEFNQNGDLDTANKHYKDHLAQLKGVLIQLGFNKKAVEDYFAALENIPERVRTRLIIEEFYRSGEIKSLERRASGGPVQSNRSYLVGENGPELVTFEQPGMVHNAAQTKSMMSGATGGSYAPAGGGGGVQVLVSAAPGAQQALAQMLLEMLRFEVRGFESLDQALSVSNR